MIHRKLPVDERRENSFLANTSPSCAPNIFSVGCNVRRPLPRRSIVPFIFGTVLNEVSDASPA